VIRDRIRERGPLTVAAFMDLALYDPEFGYYARAARRSGRAGDFFTSVDTGPLFGRLLARQIAEMVGSWLPTVPLTLVEAGASDGRLAADLMRGLGTDAPDLLPRMTLHLTERSAAAREAQSAHLADAPRPAALTTSDQLPDSFEGIVVANELLDAMPAHLLVMRGTGLREVFVAERDGDLIAFEDAPSSPRLSTHLERSGARPPVGAVMEVSLNAVDWVTDAARRLRRGFMVLIDYGFDNRSSAYGRAQRGTLTSFARHMASTLDSGDWLSCAGDTDLTADVDFGAVRAAAEAEGCTTLGLMDQTYFLMALGADRLDQMDWRERQAFKTLVLPGGLGSTMKVLVLGRNVGRPSLLGTAGAGRFT
jgi:SAM-dependent MidA family methyltransferase